MADVKWIKIVTDIFDDEKILLIEQLPEGETIIVIWFKLLCLAGKLNNSGVLLLNDKIPYTDKMLSTIFRRKESTVKLALDTFVELGMVEIIEGVITIPNWGKHQSLDQIEKKRDYMKEYMRTYREKQKTLIGMNVYNEAALPIDAWIKVLGLFGHRCAYCGARGDLVQDHAVPVNKGGKTIIGNIVPACRSCNSSKGEKDVFAWYKEQPFYGEEKCKRLRKYLCKTNVSRTDKDIDKNKITEIETEGDKEKEEKIENGLGSNNTIAQSHAAKPRNSEPLADVSALILNDGTEWVPTQKDFDEYEKLYPAVDVRQQFNNMRAWTINNPTKRKTRKGVKRFVGNWLGNEQDRGSRGQTAGRKAYQKDRGEVLDEWLRESADEYVDADYVEINEGN